MRIDEFSYDLPDEQIAQRPMPARDSSRLLVLNKAEGSWEDHQFRELPDLLYGNELLVFNNARVLPARLLGHREGVRSETPSKKTAGQHLRGTVEVFLTRLVDQDVWEALVRPGRKMQVGERILFGDGELECDIASRGELGLHPRPA